jgi:hypothetical protein
MGITLQYAEVDVPRTNHVTILVRQNARKLMQMAEVVYGPRREQLGQGDHSQHRMSPASSHVALL